MIMKHIKFLVIYTVAICAIFLPQGKAPMASLNGDMIAYYSYPVPLSKPSQCAFNRTEDKHENIDQKQAVVAALGIYFGVKHATAPQFKKDIKTDLCA